MEIVEHGRQEEAARAKSEVSVCYNGVQKELAFNPNAPVHVILQHAIHAFGITQNAHVLSLYLDGVELNGDAKAGDAGIHVGVLMNPIVPGITSKPALLERTVKAIADHGAQFVGCNVMFLEGGTRDHFMRWLQQEYPQLVDGYMQLYARKYAPAAYRKEVSNLIAAFKQKYGLVGQRFSDENDKLEENQEGPSETLALPFESRVPDPESRS